MNYFLKISIVTVIIFSFCGCYQTETNKDLSIMKTELKSIYPDSSLVIATHTAFTKAHYPKRIEEFRANPLNFNDIVFLGNSITEQAGDWSLKLNNTKARNRGIAGDTSDGVLERLVEIVHFKPEQVFILIGINDLFRDDMTSEKVFKNILLIVNEIHQGSPKTEIFVQTILPTTTETTNEKIRVTNELLINSQSSEPFKLIHLHDLYTDDDDLMNMKLSHDGVHLTEQGYNVWVKKIINLIHD